jgi:hypothetical protein
MGRAAVVNGAFDNGLDGWMRAGAVFDTGQQGVITDQTTARALLWQAVMLPPAAYVIQFDVLHTGLARVGDPGTLPDTFFATLYFTPNPGVFDPVNVAGFTAAMAIADLDFTGVTALGPGAATGPSPKGLSYLRVTMPFEVVSGFVVPLFEVNNLNFVTADSVAAVDNVSISAVPEPAPVLLCFLLAAAAWSRRWRGVR